jgi:Family of unknown function (DUF6886)
MWRLFHISDQPGIAQFDPRPVNGLDLRVSDDAVWAIDEPHLPNYLVPRDCPRVTYVCDARTSTVDRQHFFGPSRARRIIAIEPRWLERAMTEPIFVYEMPPATFECIDAHAGHHISRHAVSPLGVRRIGNPIAEMLEHDVELRVVQDLLALHEAVAGSTLSFSSTRLRNVSRPA